jgi:putative MATE family efflux protein
MGLGLIAIISFDAVDLFFVSRLGNAPLAAISFTFPAIWMLSSIVIGFEAGAASCISRAVGRNDVAGTRRQTTDTALLAGLVSLCLCLLGVVSIGPLFRLLGATDELLPLINEYMSIWYWSAPVSAVTWTCLASIRARGNTLLEGKIIVLAAILNAILDPILIFGLFGVPRLEIAGAALATLSANVVVMIGTLIYLHSTLRVFATPFTAIANIFASWRAMLHVGLPAILTNAIVPLSNGIVVAMIASYGVEAVAGYGIGVRIEPLALIAFYALSAVTSPFMGQNVAAGKYDRLEDARRQIGRFCLIFGIGLWAFAAIIAYPMSGLFTDSETIRPVAMNYLWIMGASYGAYGMVMASCAAFNGVGHPMPGVTISLLRALVLLMPLIWIGKALLGLNGIFLAGAIANIATGLLGYAWLGRKLAELPLVAANPPERTAADKL